LKAVEKKKKTQKGAMILSMQSRSRLDRDWGTLKTTLKGECEKETRTDKWEKKKRKRLAGLNHICGFYQPRWR